MAHERSARRRFIIGAEGECSWIQHRLRELQEGRIGNPRRAEDAGPRAELALGDGLAGPLAVAIGQEDSGVGDFAEGCPVSSVHSVDGQS